MAITAWFTARKWPTTNAFRSVTVAPTPTVPPPVVTSNWRRIVRKVTVWVRVPRDPGTS